MIAVQIVAVERVGSDRYRLSLSYGDVTISNVIAAVGEGHVVARHAPGIRLRAGWAETVAWSADLREQIRAAAEIAILGSFGEEEVA
jgi:hypothetical protein